MKPEVIFINEKDGIVTMSKDDVIRLMDRMYEAGKKDTSPLQMPLSYPYVVNPTTGEIGWGNTSTAKSAEGTGTTTTMTRRQMT